MPEVFLLFWIVKLLTSGMGKAGADFLGAVSIPLAAVIVIGTPYAVDSAIYLLLCGLLAWWRRSEGTLSVHSITTARRERFYATHRDVEELVHEVESTTPPEPSGSHHDSRLHTGQTVN